MKPILPRSPLGFESFASGSEGASRLFFCQGPGLGHTPRTPALHWPAHGPAQVTVPVPASSLRRCRAAGRLGRRAQEAPEVRVVLLLTPQQRQQRRAVTAQRLSQQVTVHGQPAGIRLPQAERLGRATITSRKRSLRRAATVSRDSAGLRKAEGNAKRVWLRRRGRG